MEELRIKEKGITKDQLSGIKTEARFVTVNEMFELWKQLKDPLLLPHFSCHILRHTFTTRMCEAGVNVKVIQEALGHADVSTTLNIYADATKDLKKSEFGNLELYWS